MRGKGQPHNNVVPRRLENAGELLVAAPTEERELEAVALKANTGNKARPPAIPPKRQEQRTSSGSVPFSGRCFRQSKNEYVN